MPSGYLIITNVPPEEWHAEVLGYPQVVGRLSECEIVIPEKHRHVSRRHAIIECRRQELCIQDLGSSGGTFVNSVPLLPDRPTRLMIGDRISLGGLELYFVSSESSIIQHVTNVNGSRSARNSGLSHLGKSQPIHPQPPNVDDRIRTLSPAELEVLRWIGRGLMTDKEIGVQLFRSPHTVRTQLCSIFQKLEVHSREQLIALLKQREIAWTKSAPKERLNQTTDHSIELDGDTFTMRGR